MRTAFGAAWIFLATMGCAAPPSTAPGPQQAETQLLARSTPANGATVAAPVNAMQLKFAKPVRLIEVTLDGPDGLSPMMITAVAETTDYSIPLPGLPGGNYRVNWRANASGRAYEGAISFTVRD